MGGQVSCDTLPPCKVTKGLKKMDINKLSVNIGTTIEEALAKLLPKVPYEILTVALLTKVAQVANLNRSRIKSAMIEGGDNTMQPTIYSIFFANSGIGKDRILRIFTKEILPNIRESFDSRYDQKQQGVLAEAMQEAEGLTKTQQESLLNKKLLHDYRWKSSHGTLEGLLAFAGSIEKANCGCLYYEHSEFVDLLKRKDENALIYIDALKTLYDGEVTSKLIKNDRTAIEITKCPTVMLAFSAIEGIDDDEIRSKIIELFSRGFARRSFVVLENLSTKRNYELPDINKDILEMQNERQQSAERGLEFARGAFWSMYIETQKGRTYEFTKDADRLLLRYFYMCQEAPIQTGVIGSVLNAEKAGRAWKAMQVAGLIAMFEHPTVANVDTSDTQLAIELVELFGTHLESFFKDLVSPVEQKVYEYLKTRKGELVSRMDLRQQGFVHKDRFKFFIEDAIESVETLAKREGLELIHEVEGRSQLVMLTDPEGEKAKTYAKLQKRYEELKVHKSKSAILELLEGVNNSTAHPIDEADLYQIVFPS